MSCAAAPWSTTCSPPPGASVPSGLSSSSATRGSRSGATWPRPSPDARPSSRHEQRGTGHAVRTVLEAVGTISGTVLVTYGDTPLLRTETLAALLAAARVADGNAVTVLTAEVPDPTGYGRIIRDAGGAVLEIVEDKDATPSSGRSRR